ncbi:MAG: hypothetical protein ABIQ74_08815 [Chitinophagales bacterium]
MRRLQRYDRESGFIEDWGGICEEGDVDKRGSLGVVDFGWVRTPADR